MKECKMFERMLDKNEEPSLPQIIDYMGEESYSRLCRLEAGLAAQYDFSKEIRFPFGNNYGWGYKCSHKSFHLCYMFFEKGAFTVMIQIGDRQVPAAEKMMVDLMPKSRELWANRYPCGDAGGWIQYRVMEDADLEDVIRFINVKKAPPKGDVAKL